MKSAPLLRRFLALLVLGFTIAACSPYEPVTISGLTLGIEQIPVPDSKMQPICHALEDAGYIMPYGDDGPLRWYDFGATTSTWVLRADKQPLVTIPSHLSEMFILVNWDIPADLSRLPDAVTQETVDSLATEAKNICRIVQREAAKQGIGPIRVRIRLWDLFVGLELEYFRFDPSALEGNFTVPTSDCDLLTGAYIAKSIGLNPEGRTAGQCPSLYTPS